MQPWPTFIRNNAEFVLFSVMIVTWFNKHCHFVSYCDGTEKNSDFELKMNLIDAVKSNNLDRVRFLVEQGADKDKGDSEEGNTPLWWGSRKGCLNVAQYLVEQGATLDKANNIGITPLIAAAIFGHLQVCRYLLEQGADRDKASNFGWTSLHYAANFRRLKTAKLFMRYGADLNARDNLGQLPINVASTEEIKQAIRDEPRRRMDEAPGKRATEQDRHPNAATSASSQQEEQGGTRQQAIMSQWRRNYSSNNSRGCLKSRWRRRRQWTE